MTTTPHTPADPAPARIRRSAAARDAAADRAHIVRVIAANPTYGAWLRDKVADTLTDQAAALRDAGQHYAALLVAERADRIRGGEAAA